MKVGVVGVGYWGQKVVKEYMTLVNKEIIDSLFLYDLDQSKLVPFKEVVNTCSRFDDFIYNVDAIHICTPNETHYQICKRVLEAGKHVLLEKPMAIDSRQAYELVEIAKSRDLILNVGHIYRFNNALKKVQNMIAKGFFGDIYCLGLQWTTLMSPPRNRDIIFDLAPHPIDIVNYLVNQWPMAITCRAKAYRRERLEDVAYIVAELEGKVLVPIEMSWLQPPKVRKTDIIASKRCAHIDCLNQTIQICENEKNMVYNVDVQRNNTIESELIHFVECIRYNKESINGGLVGAKNVEVLEYARKSLEKERTIRISWN